MVSHLLKDIIDVVIDFSTKVIQDPGQGWEELTETSISLANYLLLPERRDNLCGFSEGTQYPLNETQTGRREL